MSIDSDKAKQLNSDEDFLTRWSRRKLNADQQQNVLQQHSETASDIVDSQSHLTDADMPPIDSLSEDSDYSGFFSPHVSEALRQQALRKLFRSATFNVCDGLDDYDEDFTYFARLGDIVTADMRHQLEREAQRLREMTDSDTDTQMQEQNQSDVSDEAQQAADEPERDSLHLNDTEVDHDDRDSNTG